MSVEDILVWLALASLTGTALGGLVILSRTLVARAFGCRAAMLLWAGPGLRLVLPPLGLGLLAWPRGVDDTVSVVAPPAEPMFIVQPVPLVADTAAIGTAASPDLPLSLWLIPLSLWVIGAAATLIWRWLTTSSWRRTLLREAEEDTVSDSLLPVLNEAMGAAGYRGKARIIVSGAAASPQVIGLTKPLIAVPIGFAEDFTPTQQRLALQHEATHLVRRDLWMLAAAELVCALHWFNPLLRRGLSAFRADQEAACDEAVRATGAPLADYAGTLLSAAKAPAARLQPALTLNHDLKRRIETMAHPLPRQSARILGTAAIAALAFGAAAATQTAQDDPNYEPRQEREERQDRQSSSQSTSTWSTKDGKKHNKITIHRGDDIDMVLLSDPFAALTAIQPAPPKTPAAGAPRPPKPPTPTMHKPSKVIVVDKDGKTERVIDLPEGSDLRLENGTRVIVPPQFDDDWEEGMEAFGEEMEAWSEAFEEGFGAEMGAFGERMGSWGKKMGAVGKAVGELAERCEDHRERTDAPTVLSVRVDDSDETVKAVCASGGADRYRSEELEAFVEDARGVTRAERAQFMKNRNESGVRVFTD